MIVEQTVRGKSLLMAETKKRKMNVFRVARELKVTTPTVIEFLNSKEYEVSKGHQSVTDEMYLVLLQKFNFPEYQKLQSEQSSAHEQSLKTDEQQHRKKAQAELLAAGEATDSVILSLEETKSKSKVELPQFAPLKIIQKPDKVVKSKPTTEDRHATDIDLLPDGQVEIHPSVEAVTSEEVVEMLVTDPDKPKKKRRRSKKKKPLDQVVIDASDEQREVDKTADAQPDLTTEPIPIETEAIEPFVEEVAKRRKIELPQPRSLVIIEPAKKREPIKPKVVADKKEAVDGEETPKPKRKRRRRKSANRTEVVTSQGKSSSDDVIIDKITKPIAKKVEDKTDSLKSPKGKKTALPVKKARDISQSSKEDKASSSSKPDDSSNTKKRRRKGKESEGTPVAVGDANSKGRGKKRGGRSRRKAPQVDQKSVDASIKETMAQMGKRGAGRKRHSRTSTNPESTEPEIIKVTEFMTSQEFATVLDIPVQEVIKLGLEMGSLISINQRLDHDLIELFASEFEVEIEFIQEAEIEFDELVEDSAKLTERQPVVTIMGHVDHGKTTLLDHLRKTHVAEGESGGITQHIGAYEVTYKGKRLTFLDTPGHEAFTAMRARGAQVTDIVVLVVAADDQVMPQTLEAIDHAQAAGVSIVIAVNKIDKPGADSEAVYKQLADRNILVEKWGGKFQSAEISAKFGKGIESLLEEIVLASDLLELKADATASARAIVIESQLDRGLGAVATLLIQTGTLRTGDIFVVGQHSGKVRAMYNELGENVTEAIPASPVRVVGFDGVPQAGDRFMVFPTEREAREVSQRRQRQQRELSMRRIKALSLEQVSQRMKERDLEELPLIIKGDVHGSVEVLSDSLMSISTSEVKVNIIHRGVGGITESDILLAAASGAIVIGFHIHPNPQAREVARREGVEIRIYRVIHEVVDEVKKSLEGLLKPQQDERVIGGLEVRQVFWISRIGTIAGCRVTDGKVGRNNKVRLLRDSTELWSGSLSSLKRFKEDVREVVTGFECGLSLAGYSDLREGDRIEVFEIFETARKLEDSQ